jgi:hypothetical protein
MPYWRQNKKPADKEVDEDDNVEFECQADGNPRPDITWSINGEPVESKSDFAFAFTRMQEGEGVFVEFLCVFSGLCTSVDLAYDAVWKDVNQ